MASQKNDYLTDDAELLYERVRQRGLDIPSITDYYLIGTVTQDRKDALVSALDAASSPLINHDFMPVTYWYHIMLWLRQIAPVWLAQGCAHVRRPLPLFLVFGVSGLLLSGFLMRQSAQKSDQFARLGMVAIAVGGFSEMVFQVIVIVIFQILYGAVYYKIGLILTMFMIGLGVGSFTAQGIKQGVAIERRVFIKLQAGMVCYTIVLALSAYLCHRQLIAPWFGERYIWSFLPFIPGFFGGLQFPLVHRMRAKNSLHATVYAGKSYSNDLIGAAIGALCAGIFLIPALGIYGTIFILFMLNSMILFFSILFYKNSLHNA